MAQKKPKDSKPCKIDARGRVAVPPDVMAVLGVEKGDLVVFVVEGKRVELCKVEWDVKRAT